MSDETLYREYQRLVVRPGRRKRLQRLSIMWFVLSVTLAALLLLIAVHFNTKAHFPDWFVPAGMIVSAMSTVAFRRWNLSFPWLRYRWSRSLPFVAFYFACAGIAHWMNPQDSDGTVSVSLAIFCSLALGQFIAFCVANANTLYLLPPDQTDRSLKPPA